MDGVLVDFGQPPFNILATVSLPLPNAVQQAIRTFSTSGFDEINRIALLDHDLTQLCVTTVNTLLQHAQINYKQIQAIGSHGQTIRHAPKVVPSPYTVQVGNGHYIAYHSNITTITDFRTKDIIAGGQGAPLAPAFHHAFFADNTHARAIVNVGGIANITYLPTKNSMEPIIGFDSGPGNTLMDYWIKQHHNRLYDHDGAWAQSGQCLPGLLSALLADPFFARAFPKSTGLEYFNPEWLRHHLTGNEAPEDVQATLAELTATSIMDALVPFIHESSSLKNIYLCGGGAYNSYLRARLAALQPHIAIHTTQALGIAPQWVEAIGFAWLAKQTLNRQPGNIPSVTGAAKPVILGAVHYP